MPTPGDGILESELEKGEVMDPQVANIMVQQLTQTGVIAQNNFVSVQKVIDYDYLENKRVITLDEAVGVREVASKSVPAGPTSA